MHFLTSFFSYSDPANTAEHQVCDGVLDYVDWSPMVVAGLLSGLMIHLLLVLMAFTITC